MSQDSAKPKKYPKGCLCPNPSNTCCTGAKEVSFSTQRNNLLPFEIVESSDSNNTEKPPLYRIDLSAIPVEKQRKAKQQLRYGKWHVPLKRLPIESCFPIAKLRDKESSTRKRPRGNSMSKSHSSVVKDSRQKGKSLKNPPVSASSQYDVVNVSDTLLVLQKPADRTSVLREDTVKQEYKYLSPSSVSLVIDIDAPGSLHSAELSGILIEYSFNVTRYH